MKNMIAIFYIVLSSVSSPGAQRGLIGGAKNDVSRTLQLRLPSTLILGEPARIVITNAKAGTIVRVHAFRSVKITPYQQGSTSLHNVVLHAWADFRADGRGRVLTASSSALSGTYTGIDNKGLLWSGWPEDDPRLGSVDKCCITRKEELSTEELAVVAESSERAPASGSSRMLPYSDRIVFKTLDALEQGVNGVFAAPKLSSRLGTLILLHGSEGGSYSTARNWAGSFAERGFAVLSLNYVSYSDPLLPGVPTALANIPLELLERAHSWLLKQSNVDQENVALVGISKGAEFALVGAAHFDWVHAVVACAPSDVVWAGYGRPAEGGELLSSWSLHGTPLPFVAYDRYEDVFSGKATSVEVHDRSRLLASPKELKEARITVEDINGPILLISGGKDQVWSSTSMASNIAKKVRERRGSVPVIEEKFPLADHYVCGNGSEPVRAHGVDRATDAAARTVGYSMTISFLHEVLHKVPKVSAQTHNISAASR